MTTIDPSEVEKFSRIASEWWDERGKFAPLHRINPVRIDFIKRHVCKHLGRDENSAKPFSGLKFLDIGCGGGLLSEPMARLGASVTGVDASVKNIKVASLHAEQSGLAINYIHSSVEELAKGTDKFDVILNMEVIEHVADVDLFMESCIALLKQEHKLDNAVSRPQHQKSGIIFTATINRTLKSFAFAKIGAEYILRWLPAGTHDWNKFIKPSELHRILRGGGLSVIETKGMSLNLLTNSWGLTDDLSVNYLLAATHR